MTLSEAAAKLKISRQAVYAAIHTTKKLKAEKIKGRILIARDSVTAYKKIKHLRKYSLFQGKPLFDTEKGEISIREASKMFRVSSQRLYYLVRVGKIPSYRKKRAYVLNIKDLEEGLEKHKRKVYSSYK